MARVHGVIQDLTERKTAEERIRLLTDFDTLVLMKVKPLMDDLIAWLTLRELLPELAQLVPAALGLALGAGAAVSAFERDVVGAGFGLGQIVSVLGGL